MERKGTAHLFPCDLLFLQNHTQILEKNRNASTQPEAIIIIGSQRCYITVLRYMFVPILRILTLTRKVHKVHITQLTFANLGNNVGLYLLGFWRLSYYFFTYSEKKVTFSKTKDYHFFTFLPPSQKLIFSLKKRSKVIAFLLFLRKKLYPQKIYLFFKKEKKAINF